MRTIHHRLPAALISIVVILGAGSSATAEAPREFLPETQRLGRLVACAGDQALPDGVSARFISWHCARIGKLMTRYRDGWLKKARAFFAEVIPHDLPDTVVYPFGGADLLNALSVFPDAREITTISLESTGDPTAWEALSWPRLKASLTAHRQFFGKLVVVNHNRTIDLAELTKDPLPAPLAFALVGLAVHDRELVGVRFFELGDDGAPRYRTATPDAGGFDNVELRFRRRGDDAAPIQVFRHIAANLDDRHLADDPRLVAHLRAKGRFTAMTKAASYLLWRKNFSTIRGILLNQMAWMVSDSSGIAPFDAEPAGFDQVTYGRFAGIMFSGTKRGERAMAKLFAAQPHRPLGFYFGYPSKANHRHLVITRPRPPATGPAQP